MSKKQIGSIFIAVAVIVVVIVFFQLRSAYRVTSLSGVSSQPSITQQGDMKLTSSAFAHNQAIPPQYTCDGADMNPPLSISEVPDTTASLALIVDDPDASAGDWVHWLAWNIDSATTEIAEGDAPSGVQGTTDFNRTGWGGPCPPSGTHHYQFKLYALDAVLDLDASARKADLEAAMQGHVLAQTVLVGTYRRGE
jgi:Raf kinase inhibitor-like YbhB/YbcL family protein